MGDCFVPRSDGLCCLLSWTRLTRLTRLQD